MKPKLNNTHHSEAITWLRFPLIFFIIMLHCYSSVALSGSHTTYFNFIYPFSLWLGETGVPGFFFISGFLFSRRAVCNLKQLCLKKAIRLLIPYFSIALLWMIPIRLMVGYRGYACRTVFDILIRCILLGEDNGHLWFLPCLYLCFLFSAAALRFFERVRLNTARSPALLLIASVVVFSAQSLFLRIPFSSFLVNFSRYWIWFCLGFAFHETQWLHKLSKYKALFFLLSVISAALSIRVSSHLNLFAQLAILIFAYSFHCERSRCSNNSVIIF